MFSRILIVLVALLAVMPAWGSAASPCDDAHDLLAQAATASDPASAPLLAASLEACPLTQGLVEGSPAASQAEVTFRILQGIYDVEFGARDCGYESKTTGNSSSAPIEVDWQASFVGPENGYDQGPAVATYEPATRLITYGAQGATYGLTAQSDGVGTIKVLGVPLMATHAVATAGCTDTNNTLCWGSGTADIQLDSEVTIHAYSWFYQC